MSASDLRATDPCAPILDRALHLAEDHTFAAVRDWKAAHPGALAIGHMPIYAPRPLLEALGCLPVAVFGAGAQIDIIRGDSYFQSYICHIPRNTLELALAGDLDVMDGMIFPSICDVIRNLGGMWRLLFPDRVRVVLGEVLVLDGHALGLVLERTVETEVLQEFQA